MGIQFCFSSKPITIMKSLLFVLSLLPLLTQHPRLSLRPKLTPGTDGTTDGADTTATLRYGYRRYWKREAEAEPTAAANPDAEADPAVFYRSYYGYPYAGYYGAGYNGGYYG